MVARDRKKRRGVREEERWERKQGHKKAEWE